MSLLMKREAVQSSRMEGTWSTIDQVLTPQTHIHDHGSLSDRSSVVGYAKVLDVLSKRVEQEKFKAFNVQLVEEIHRIILKDDTRFQGRAGKLRAEGQPGAIVHIGNKRIEDSIFNPPLPKHVSSCLKDVMDWLADAEFSEMGDAGMGLTLPERMAIGHAHFEAVHPFPDGNGRVGRILMSLQMVASSKQPLYLSGYIEAEKYEYMKCLEVAQKKLDYTPLVEFISEAILSAHEESEETIRALKTLPEVWKTRGKVRSNSSLEKSLNWMLEHPIFSVQQFAEKFNISFVAASKAIEKLVASKIIHERTGQARNRLFAAEEVIHVLSRDFKASPDLSIQKAKVILGIGEDV